ncbi:hypothetical protein K3495_g17425, partial [Podosphaera aphanis]
MRTLSQAPQDEINDWFDDTRAKIMHLNNEQGKKVTRILYTSRDLDSVESEELPPTDLYLHRVRLKDGTPPFNRPKQRNEIRRKALGRSDRKKDLASQQHDMGVRATREYSSGDLVMLFDNREAGKKLRPSWRGPFVIRGFGGDM